MEMKRARWKEERCDFDSILLIAVPLVCHSFLYSPSVPLPARTAPACLRPPCACYFGGSGDAEDGSQRVSLAGLERKHSPSLERTLS